MEYIFTSNEFEICKCVKWDDVIEKINLESSLLEHKLLFHENYVPTIALHTDFYPETIQHAYDEVKAKRDITILHIYASFCKNAPTFGRHRDNLNVLLVQSIGKMSYLFDDGVEVQMKPGDSLFIRKEVYHNPIVHEPRVTLSFSWE